MGMTISLCADDIDVEAAEYEQVLLAYDIAFQNFFTSTPRAMYQFTMASIDGVISLIERFI